MESETDETQMNRNNVDSGNYRNEDYEYFETDHRKRFYYLDQNRDYRNCRRHSWYESIPLAKVCGHCGDLIIRKKKESKGWKYLTALSAFFGLVIGTAVSIDTVRNDGDLSEKIKNDYVRVSFLSREEQLRLLDDNKNGVVDFEESENGIVYMGHYYVPKKVKGGNF
jgi:hypothetical protein